MSEQTRPAAASGGQDDASHDYALLFAKSETEYALLARAYDAGYAAGAAATFAECAGIADEFVDQGIVMPATIARAIRARAALGRAETET